MEKKFEKIFLFVVFLAAFLLHGCLDKEKPYDTTKEISRIIKIDGSSTVYLITEAVAEEFQKSYPNVRVTVGISGTGGGFKKFCANEIDINDASRPIKQKEIDSCRENGVEFIEIPVAIDGLSVVVNKDNNWVDCITVKELKEIWKPESKIKKWSQIRDGWPDKEIYLVGPDTDSGTFDYFTEAIVGKEKESRSDYTASADDNVLVQAISGEKYSLGYFGYAYYLENKDKLKALSIDDEKDENGNGCVMPTYETIKNGEYQPLSRPLFIYINKKSAERQEVQEFIKYYLSEKSKKLIQEVGYLHFKDKVYELAKDRFEKKKTGSIFSKRVEGQTIEEILEGDRAIV